MNQKKYGAALAAPSQTSTSTHNRGDASGCQAKTAASKEQTVKIDGNWRIVRLDKLNWQIQFRGKGKGFFGSIVAAIEALPRHMLNESAKNSLAEVIERQRAIAEMIRKAFTLQIPAKPIWKQDGDVLDLGTNPNPNP
jgi:hypothetical protein